MGGSRAEQAQGPARAGLGHQLQGALGPRDAQSRAVHGIMYGAARADCYKDNMESPSLETRRGARDWWGGGPAEGWDGEGERWLEGQTQFLQQAQSSGLHL